MGLHWLHFSRMGKDADPCRVQRWAAIEAWVEEVLRLPVAVRIYKTTNPICDSKYVGHYQEAARAYASLPLSPALLEACVGQLQNELALEDSPHTTRSSGLIPTEPTPGADVLLSYCIHAPFIDRAVVGMNRRSIRWMQDRLCTPSPSGGGGGGKADKGSSGGGGNGGHPAVGIAQNDCDAHMGGSPATTCRLRQNGQERGSTGIMDDYILLRGLCRFSKEADGRHYPLLKLASVRLLVNLVGEVEVANRK